MCLKPRCQTCHNVQVSKEFTNADGSKTFEIRNGPLNCSTPNVVYQISCKTCNVQYVGSSKGPFRLRFNNYKSHHRTFLERMSKGTLGTGKSVPQRELHSHFAQSDHNGIEDMQFTLIDSGPKVPTLGMCHLASLLEDKTPTMTLQYTIAYPNDFIHCEPACHSC